MHGKMDVLSKTQSKLFSNVHIFAKEWKEWIMLL